MRGRIYLASAMVLIVLILIMNGCGNGEVAKPTSTPKIIATPPFNPTPHQVTPSPTPSPEPPPTPAPTPPPTLTSAPTPPPPPKVQKIVFDSTREPRGEEWSNLFIMNADGSGVKRLGEVVSHDSCMAFPDESYSGECEWP